MSPNPRSINDYIEAAITQRWEQLMGVQATRGARIDMSGLAVFVVSDAHRQPFDDVIDQELADWHAILHPDQEQSR